MCGSTRCVAPSSSPPRGHVPRALAPPRPSRDLASPSSHPGKTRADRSTDRRAHARRIANELVEELARQDERTNIGRREHRGETRIGEARAPLERRELTEEVPRAHVVDRVTVLKDTGRAVDDHVELATDVPLLDDRGAGRYANLARHACHAFEVARTESREQRETLDRGRIHTWRSEPALVQARIAVVLDHGRRRRRVVHRCGLEMLKHRLDVFPARRVVEDAQPDRETAAQFRRGDEADRATREKANQLGIQPLAAVLVVVAEASAEAEHAERRGTHELERRAALDALVRPQCEIEAAVDRDAERRQTEILDRQPDLDRVRCPRELHPVVGEVHLSRHRALRVSQVVRMDLERVEELPSLADEETAAFEGLVEALVRIERDRVGDLDARESGAAALGDRGEPAIRAVDVEPRATLAADRGDLGQRIDGTGAGGSGGPGGEEWFAAGG